MAAACADFAAGAGFALDPVADRFGAGMVDIAQALRVQAHLAAGGHPLKRAEKARHASGGCGAVQVDVDGVLGLARGGGEAAAQQRRDLDQRQGKADGDANKPSAG